MPEPLASRARCYIASPLGFDEAGRQYYRDIYLPRLATVIDPVDPWALVSAPELDAARNAGREREFALEIGERNRTAIRGCSMLVAYLEGQEPDSGTVAELGYAAGVGLQCFGLRSDSRQAGDAGTHLNLQVEAFVLSSGGRISTSLDELVADLTSVGSVGRPKAS